MLQRHVDVLDDLVLARDRVEDRVGHGRGVRVHHADPAEAVDGAESPQQEGQAVAQAEVEAVARRVLGDQHDLLHTPRGQRPGLRHDVLDRPAAMQAAQRRDDAEGARVVAALADLHVGEMRRGRQDAGGRVIVDPLRPALGGVGDGGFAFDRAQHVVHLSGAEGGVDLGDLAAQLLVVALGEAAGDHQTPRAARLLLARHLEDRVDRFLLGPVDERARVDDDDVRLFRVRHQPVPALRQVPEHHLAVDEVLGAPQADHAHAQRLRAGGQCALSGASMSLPHSRSLSRSLAA